MTFHLKSKIQDPGTMRPEGVPRVWKWMIKKFHVVVQLMCNQYSNHGRNEIFGSGDRKEKMESQRTFYLEIKTLISGSLSYWFSQFEINQLIMMPIFRFQVNSNYSKTMLLDYSFVCSAHTVFAPVEIIQKHGFNHSKKNCVHYLTNGRSKHSLMVSSLLRVALSTLSVTRFLHCDNSAKKLPKKTAAPGVEYFHTFAHWSCKTINLECYGWKCTEKANW